MLSKKLICMFAGIGMYLSSAGAVAFSSEGFDKPLPAEQVFSPKSWVQDGGLYVGFEIPNGYYLYADETKLFGNSKQEITGQQLDNKTLVSDPTFGDVDVYYEKALYYYPGLEDADGMKLTYRGCMEDMLCYLPQTSVINPIEGVTPLSFDGLTSQFKFGEEKKPSTLVTIGEGGGYGVLSIALFFFIAGIGLSFTPCILPMVPILASIITSGAKNNTQAKLLAMSYGAGVVIAYMLLGAGIALLSSSLNISSLMQSAWFVAPLAILFLFFGLITMGSINIPKFSMIGKSDEKLTSLQSKWRGMGYVGSLMAGLVSVLVLSPCVSAPLGAAVAYLASEGTFLSSVMSLGALSFGMILPLMIATTVGHKFLPKAGPWMGNIKLLTGCVMILMALWTVLKIIPEQAAPLLITITLYYMLLLLMKIDRNADKRYSILLGFCIIMPLAIVLWLIILRAPSLNADGQISDSTYAFEKISTKQELDLFLSNGERQLVYVGADWCQSCYSLEKNIFPGKEFRVAAAGFSVIKLDITNSNSEVSRWMGKQGIYGAPGFLVFDGKKLIRAKMGEVSSDDLAYFLTK